MPKLKPGTIIPSPEEEAAIRAGINADPDTYEPTDEEFKMMRPLRGRPKTDSPKRPVTIRLDVDVVSAFEKSGPGWQTRINEVLKEYVQSHKIA